VAFGGNEKMFVKIFGENPQTKILDFLADHPDYDYTITELAEKTGVSKPTTNKVIRGLLKERLVIVSRKIGRSKLYKLNTRNEIVKTILKFEFEIAKKLLTWRRKRQRNIVNLHLKYNILRSQPGN